MIRSLSGSLEAGLILAEFAASLTSTGFQQVVSDPTQLLDCLVVGCGPAGLTAAIYLGRYRRTALIVDGGSPRAAMIPTSHNYPGFPQGMHGMDLLAAMRQQAALWGALIEPGWVTSIARTEDGNFAAALNGRTVRARTVMLCTGVHNRKPVGVNDAVHTAGVAAKLIRYCPICDGPEASGKRILIVGSSTHGVSEAAFIRNYSSLLTVIPDQSPALTDADRATLAAMGAAVIDQPLLDTTLADNVLRCYYGNTSAEWDIMYPSLGSFCYTELAEQLGCSLAPDGEINVDAHFQTTVPGVWAAGDVVEGLDQVVTAEHHAATGATAVHNLLRAGQWGIAVPTVPVKNSGTHPWAPGIPNGEGV